MQRLAETETGAETGTGPGVVCASEPTKAQGYRILSGDGFPRALPGLAHRPGQRS